MILILSMIIYIDFFFFYFILIKIKSFILLIDLKIICYYLYKPQIKKF